MDVAVLLPAVRVPDLADPVAVIVPVVRRVPVVAAVDFESGESEVAAASSDVGAASLPDAVAVAVSSAAVVSLTAADSAEVSSAVGSAVWRAVVEDRSDGNSKMPIHHWKCQDPPVAVFCRLYSMASMFCTAFNSPNDSGHGHADVREETAMTVARSCVGRIVGCGCVPIRRSRPATTSQDANGRYI